MKKKKINLIGLIFKIILLGIVVSGIYLYAGMKVIKPKDIGVTYTEKDFLSALEKTGIQIVLNGENVNSISVGERSNYITDKYSPLMITVLAAENKKFGEYDVTFDNYEKKSIVLTPSEASAFLNEIAPGFFWFDNIQVKVLANGKMEGSSKVYMGRILDDLYSDVKNKIPIPFPNVVNTYGIASVSISNNNLSWKPDIISIGQVPLPEKYLKEEPVRAVESHIERIYRIIPGLEIISLVGNEAGDFVIDVVLPLKITVTGK